MLQSDAAKDVNQRSPRELEVDESGRRDVPQTSEDDLFMTTRDARKLRRRQAAPGPGSVVCLTLGVLSTELRRIHRGIVVAVTVLSFGL